MVPTLKFSVTTSARRTSSQLQRDGELVPLPVLGGGDTLLHAGARSLHTQRHALAPAVA
jgi:hypothetical protein